MRKGDEQGLQVTQGPGTYEKLSRMPQIDTGKRLVLSLFLIMEVVLIGAALWPTCWFVLACAPEENEPILWVLIILGAILIFNYAYLVALLILRLIIPRPKEGFFPRGSDGRPPREGFVLMLNLLLVKARFHPPWAALISSVLVSIFPFHLFYPRLFGPNTPSITLGDTYICTDPALFEAGKNVQIGGRCFIVCHLFDNRGLFIRKTTIGDNVVIGGDSMLLPGVQIGHNSVIGLRSLVLAGTIIKPYEFWSGIPAKKIKDLSPGEDVQPEKGWEV